MKKKFVAVMLTIMVLSSILYGCNSNNQNGTNEPTQAPSQGNIESDTNDDEEEVIYAKILLPGSEPQDKAAVLELVNAKLMEDKVGIQIETVYYPWDAWDQKINLMLSIGEEFDMFSVMNDRVTLSNYAARGALADISELIQDYGANILDLNPDMLLKAGQVGGIQYGLPAYWTETAIDPQITLRTDLLREYGIDTVPTTFEELTAAFETVMNKWKGANKPYIPLVGSTTTSFSLDWKNYDEWPFVVYDQLFYVNQDGTIDNYFATEAFKKDCENARLWYQKGLINPDILVYSNDMMASQLDAGDWVVVAGAYGRALENLQNNYPDLVDEDIIALDLNPDQPYVRPYGTRNMMAIPLSSKNPKAGVKFVNWLYASQENYDLFLYGREGIDWEKVEPHNRVAIIDPALGKPLYSVSDWMIGNLEFVRPAIGTSTAYNNVINTKNETAIEGIAAQFTFDASTVQTQYIDVKSVISEFIVPMACGIIPYEENIDQAMQLLEKAGVNDLVNEFKGQLAESK